MIMVKSIVFFLFLLITAGLAIGAPFDTHLKFFLILSTLVATILLTRKPFSLKSYGMVLALAFGICGLKSMLPISHIQEGGNVFVPEAVVQKQLPSPVYDYLSTHFKTLYPHHRLLLPEKLYAFSVEQFYSSSPLSRRLRDLDFSSPYTLRMGAMNTMAFNTYSQFVPPRESLPYYLRYDFPKELVLDPATRLCWKGNLFVITPDGKSHFKAKEIKCDPLLSFFNKLDQDQYTLYAAFVDPAQPLELKLNLSLAQKIYRGLEDLLSIIGWCLILLLLLQTDRIKQLIRIPDFQFKLTLFGLNFLFATILAFYYMPGALDGFILFTGGNDGLMFCDNARYSLEALLRRDWFEFFRSTESLYDLQPWHRYTYALNLLLFGETHFGYMLIALIYPFVMYALCRRLFRSLKWARILSFLYVLVPIFESFGFSNFYMIRQVLMNFAEPLGYLLFFGGMCLSISYIALPCSGDRTDVRDFKPTLLFLTGLCFAGAVGLRSNVFVGAVMYLLCLAWPLIRTFSVTRLAALGAGFVPILLVPLHNYYFGHIFVPFTVSAVKPEILAISPKEYLSFFKGLFNLNPDFHFVSKILSHFTGEVSLRMPWLYLTLLLSLCLLFTRSPALRLARVVSWVGLSQFSLTFFFHVGGRYGHLHWSLLLLAILMWAEYKIRSKKEGITSRT